MLHTKLSNFFRADHQDPLSKNNIDKNNKVSETTSFVKPKYCDHYPDVFV